jgi:hypothetical protein
LPGVGISIQDYKNDDYLSGRPLEGQQRMNFRVENCSFSGVESEYLEYSRLKIVRRDGLLDNAACHDRWWLLNQLERLWKRT